MRAEALGLLTKSGDQQREPDHHLIMPVAVGLLQSSPLKKARDLEFLVTRTSSVVRFGLVLLVWLITTTPARAQATPLHPGAPQSAAIDAEAPRWREHGPSRSFAYVADRAASLFVWVTATEFDPMLHAVRGTTELSDEDSGGGSVPLLRIDMEPGDHVLLTVAAQQGNGTGTFEVHAILAPETEATRAAAAAAKARVRVAERHRAGERFAAARRETAAAAAELLAVPGIEQSALLADELWTLGVLAYHLGDPQTAATAFDSLRVFRERHLPLTSSAVTDIRFNTGAMQLLLDQPEKAGPVFSSLIPVLVAQGTTAAARLQQARLNLATCHKRLGDLAAALPLEQAALAIYEDTLPPTHRDLLRLRGNLGITLDRLGHYEDALGQYELALDHGRDADDEIMIPIKASMAELLRRRGDLLGARAKAEEVLQYYESHYPADNRELLNCRLSLGTTLFLLGDDDGARQLHEETFAQLVGSAEPDDLLLQFVRASYAQTLLRVGEPVAAERLASEALARLSARVEADDPNLDAVRFIVASIFEELDRREPALELREESVRRLSASLPADDPRLCQAQSWLANALLRSGQLERARTLAEASLAGLLRTSTAGDPLTDDARDTLIWILARSGDVTGAHRHMLAAIEACRESLGRRGQSLSLREIEAIAQTQGNMLAGFLSLAGGFGNLPPDADLDRSLFELIETLRGAGIAALHDLHVREHSPEVDRLVAEARRVRERVTRLAHAAAPEYAATVRERDRNERALREAITAADGETPPPLSADRLARQLPAGAAIVAFWGYRRTAIDPDGGRLVQTQQLAAFVLRHDGQLARVELGTQGEVEAAVDRWRAAILAPVAGGPPPNVDRGRPATVTSTDSIAATGLALRRLVFDPLLPALGEAAEVQLALDGALHSVPFDALPGDQAGSVLGDRFRFGLRTTLTGLRSRATAAGPPRLLAFGGIDYDDEPSPGKVASAPHAGAASVRASSFERGFGPLAATGREINDIAALHAQRFGDRELTTLRDGHAASRRALFELAPTARFLHLATHGFFAPESIASSRDGLGTPGPVLGFSAQVRGLSPMVLCGLALAGANRDAEDDDPGVVTAEEIAALDLRNCELAVLSACDTNVGVRRAGQGVDSLQKALHAAGARTVITSLWRVDDEATRELMVDFYQRLWVQGRPKATALAEAKSLLRHQRDDAGQPRYQLRHWAAWVLSGDPD